MAAAPAGGGPRALSQREQDIQMMLAADVHLGTKNCDFQVERYVYKRRTDGTNPNLSRLTKCLPPMLVVFDI
jgi:small subunit ribosomal protein SAe